MANRLLGQDFTPPDIRGKVTGKAKYAEDFRVDGMAFCKLLLGPMPHARVTSIDTSEAEKMEGVLGVLTAADVPAGEGANEVILTNTPHFIGEPVLAVAAIDETTAADALEKVRVTYEPLPYVIDPLESLFPGGKDARGDGFNIGTLAGLPPAKLKWAAADFARVKQGDELPMGKPAEEWNFGDVEAQFRQCKVVYDERFVTAALAHHSMEPRTCMAYWQNGKCFVHASLQSQSFAVPGLAQMLGIKPEDLVQLVRIGLEHPELRYEIFYGASNNERAWWDNSRAHAYGYRPNGRAEEFRDEALSAQAKLPADPVGDFFQGGTFCSAEFAGDTNTIWD